MFTDVFSFTFYKCWVFSGKNTVIRFVCTITGQADDKVYDVVADLDAQEVVIRVYNLNRHFPFNKNYLIKPFSQTILFSF